MELKTYVVAATVVARVGDDAYGAVLESQDCGTGVDVTGFFEECFATVTSRGKNLNDLTVRDPADGVDVVDRAVVVDPTLGGDVFRRRGRGVEDCRADGVHEAQIAGT